MGRVFGIISLILGIAGLVFSPFYIIVSQSSIFWFLTLMLAVPGIILGAIGIKKDDKPGLAIAGLIISSIAIVLWIIFMVIGDIRRRII